MLFVSNKVRHVFELFNAKPVKGVCVLIASKYETFESANIGFVVTCQSDLPADAEFFLSP